MDVDEVRRYLDSTWREVVEEAASKNAAAQVPEADHDIDRFVDSDQVTLRYVVVTQLLGKVADHDRSLLCLQAADGEQGAWDARSFCSNVIVPWVFLNHNVLGTSPDPYVNNPARRSRLDVGLNALRYREAWEQLADWFSALDNCSPTELEDVFRRCLRSVARRLSRQEFVYPVPNRISLDNTISVLDKFLREPSGGLRPLAITAAVMRILGDALSLFFDVHAQGLNEADRAAGVPGDVICRERDGRIALAVEVKGEKLTIAHLRSSIGKAVEAEERLTRLLFAVPGIVRSDTQAIEAKIEEAWNTGLAIHLVELKTFIHSTFALLSDDLRPRFLREVGAELDRRGVYRHREAWRQLLSALTL